MAFQVSLRGRARALATRLWNEHASPRDVGWAVAIGGFVGCSPLIGFHLWIAIALATIANKSRVWASLGSRVSSFFLLPLVVTADVQIGHAIRTGGTLAISTATVLEQAKRGSLFVDWWIGSVPVGIGVGAAVGLLAAGISSFRAARRGNSAKVAPSAAATPMSSHDHPHAGRPPADAERDRRPPRRPKAEAE